MVERAEKENENMRSSEEMCHEQGELFIDKEGGPAAPRATTVEASSASAAFDQRSNEFDQGNFKSLCGQSWKRMVRKDDIFGVQSHELGKSVVETANTFSGIVKSNGNNIS